MEEENNKLKAGIEEIRMITMTADEKKRVLHNILQTRAPAPRPQKSPYVFNPFFAVLLRKNHFMYYGLLSFLIVILGGGAAFASSGSLPGNVLYPLKVNVVEPLGAVFKFSPEAKIKYQGKLATERLIEAETLKDENRLDSEKESRLSELLLGHTEAFNKAVLDYRENKKESNEDGENGGDDAVTDFEANMKAHAQILDILDKDKEEGNDAKVRRAARQNGEKVRKELESKKDKNPSQYEKRRGVVESMIDSTDSTIEGKAGETSPEKSAIIENTRQTLERAKQSLKEAEEDSKNGDLKKAYSKLLDSESSAKEAQIFLKTGLEWQDKKSGSSRKDDSRDKKGKDR